MGPNFAGEISAISALKRPHFTLMKECSFVVAPVAHSRVRCNNSNITNDGEEERTVKGGVLFRGQYPIAHHSRALSALRLDEGDFDAGKARSVEGGGESTLGLPLEIHSLIHPSISPLLSLFIISHVRHESPIKTSLRNFLGRLLRDYDHVVAVFPS